VPQVVVFQHRPLLSEYDHLTRTVREPLEHLTRISSALSRRAASLVSLPAGGADRTPAAVLTSPRLHCTRRVEVGTDGCVRDLQPEGGLTANNAALGQEQHWTERHGSAASRIRARRSDTKGAMRSPPAAQLTPAAGRDAPASAACDGKQQRQRSPSRSRQVIGFSPNPVQWSRSFVNRRSHHQ